MNVRRLPVTLLMRVVLLAGLAIYVVGALVGWLSGSDGFHDIVIDPHELVGGEWIWLGLVPPILAIFAPFTLRWLSFLWLTPLPALLFVVGVIVYREDISAPFPFYFQEIHGLHWGIVLSLVGAALATLALILALLMVIRDRGQASSLRIRQRISQLQTSRRRVAIGLILAGAAGLIAITVAVAYDPDADRIEDRITDLVRKSEETNTDLEKRIDSGAESPARKIKAHCDGKGSEQWRCVYETEHTDGSSSSSTFTTDGSQESLVFELFGPKLAYRCFPKSQRRRWNAINNRAGVIAERIQKRIDPFSDRYEETLEADPEYRRLTAEGSRIYEEYAPSGPGEACGTLKSSR
jgi:hypothetical protein